MKNEMDLQQIVYHVLLTQIQFGTYSCGGHLPTMEQAARWFLVSLDTVRPAYRRLKREGLITLSKNVGAVVCARYSEQEKEMAIQDFFSRRQTAMTDICHTMEPLFVHARWCALKQAPPALLDRMEALALRKETPPPFSMLQLLYEPLQNDLLTRLAWQTYMFFQAPFLSVPEISAAFSQSPHPILEIVALCRQKNWTGLREALEALQNRQSTSLDRFYAKRITCQPPREPDTFSWSAYQKTSQVCYTLARELLNQICRGACAPGSFLPSQGRLAEAHGVSLSTVRRTLGLLCSAGATRSINGVGTQVLPLDASAENCDFSNHAVRKRLLESVQALQILALSCGSAAQMTLAAMSAEARQKWQAQIEQTKALGRPELAAYVCLESIALHAPSKTLRAVYDELVGHLFWGYPLRCLYGGREALDRRFAPSLEAMLTCLSRCDAQGFAHELETLLTDKVSFAVAQLKSLGFERGQLVSLPEKYPR